MIDKIEAFLTNNFQKNIEIEVDDKSIKKGKFILYKIASVTNYFHIELYIERPTNREKIDTIKIPIPFEYEAYPDEGLLYFDYRVNSLFRNNYERATFTSLIDTTTQEPQKFLNKIVVFHFD